MGCCGQGRVMLRSGEPTPANLAPPPTRAEVLPPSPHAPASGHATVGLRYMEKQPIRVRGPATGQVYQFSERAPVRGVDARDAAALLRTRFFRRAV